jgi:hypothetical protein
MSTRHLLLAATAVCVLGTTDLRAEGLQGRWIIALQAGSTTELGGDAIGGVTGTLFGMPATVDAVSYKKVYGPSFLGQVMIGYGVSPKSEIVVRGMHYKSNAVGVQAGTVAGDPLYAFLDPYEEWGVEAGWHWYIAVDRRLKSYLGPTVGARFLNSILGAFTVPDLQSSILNVPVHGSGTVAVFGVDLGFTFDFSRHVFVGMETGVRYQTAPPNPGALPGLQALGSGGQRWSAPVCGSLGVRF